jgi:hypothetical protein
VHRLAAGTVPRLRAAHWTIAGVLIVGGFALSVAVAVAAGRLEVALRPVIEAAAWIALALVTLSAVAALRGRAAFALVAATAASMAADLGRNNGPNESTALPPGQFDVLDPNTKNETIQLLKKLLREPLPSARRDRVELVGVGFEWPNAGLVHGFEHTLGYNPLRLAEFAEAVGARDHVAGPDQRTFTPLFPSYRSLLADTW